MVEDTRWTREGLEGFGCFGLVGLEVEALGAEAVEDEEAVRWNTPMIEK